MRIAGTGHRPDKLGGYSKEVKDKLFRVACDTIPKGTTEIISGMALGWDMALAHAAIWHGIPFVAAVPFNGQESRWPKESKDEWQYLMDEADEIMVVSGGGYAPYKMQTRNIWMVDQCDRVLALWNGTDGGTANCVKYAQSINKPIINVWEKFIGEEKEA